MNMGGKEGEEKLFRLGFNGMLSNLRYAGWEKEGREKKEDRKVFEWNCDDIKKVALITMPVLEKIYAGEDPYSIPKKGGFLLNKKVLSATQIKHYHIAWALDILKEKGLIVSYKKEG